MIIIDILNGAYSFKDGCHSVNEIMNDVQLCTPTIVYRLFILPVQWLAFFSFSYFSTVQISSNTPNPPIPLLFLVQLPSLHLSLSMSWFHRRHGGRDSAVVRALASNQCGPSSVPARCHMWVEFVVGSRLAPKVFIQAPRFSSLTKTNTPISNSTRI